MFDIRGLIEPYLAALWRWRWGMLGVTWLCCLLGWLGVAMLADKYTVKARLLVDTETILAPLMQDLAVTPDFDRQVDMMRDTLFSVPNIELLIKTTGLDQAAGNHLDHEELVQHLLKRVQLDIQANNLFEISYTHADPEIAHSVVNSMLQIFVQQNLGHSQRDVEGAREFIDQQIASYDLKLREAELKVAEFRRKHAEELGGVERNIRDLDRAESDVRRLQAELEAAFWRRDQLKLRLGSTPEMVPAANAGGQAVSPAQQQLDSLNQELTRKLLIYTEQHPDIIALRRLIEEAARQLQNEQQGAGLTAAVVKNPLRDQLAAELQTLEVSVDDLQRRVRVAQAEVETLTTKVSEAPQVEADLTRLTRDYDVLLRQYEQLTQRRESAQLAEDLDTDKRRVEFRVVDPPAMPLKPSGPPHGLLMAGVLFLGIGAGGSYAFLRMRLSDAFLTTSQLRHVLELPVLGGVSEAQLTGRSSPVGDRLGLVGGSLALVLAFVALFYLYQVSPTKPDLGAIVAGLTAQLTSVEANAGS
jgi:polysaccharide chain length determinant protein (PEP-CTERM system associated)